AAVLCGVAPVRLAACVDVVGLLKLSSAKGGPRQSRRTLNAMVVMQFAVSTILLASAGILVRTYLNAESAASGFQTTGLIATTIDADQIGLDRPTGVRLYREVVERLSALPSVSDVSLTRDVPLGPGRRVSVTAAGDTASTLDSVTATAM